MSCLVQVQGLVAVLILSNFIINIFIGAALNKLWAMLHT